MVHSLVRLCHVNHRLSQAQLCGSLPPVAGIPAAPVLALLRILGPMVVHAGNPQRGWIVDATVAAGIAQRYQKSELSGQVSC